MRKFLSRKNQVDLVCLGKKNEIQNELLDEYRITIENLKKLYPNFIFELEDKIRDVCKSFSLKNVKQEQNLIEMLKTNCRKTIKEKTGKRPYTNVNLVRI